MGAPRGQVPRGSPLNAAFERETGVVLNDRRALGDVDEVNPSVFYGHIIQRKTRGPRMSNTSFPNGSFLRAVTTGVAANALCPLARLPHSMRGFDKTRDL